MDRIDDCCHIYYLLKYYVPIDRLINFNTFTKQSDTVFFCRAKISNSTCVKINISCEKSSEIIFNVTYNCCVVSKKAAY